MTKDELIIYIKTVLMNNDGKLLSSRTSAQWLKKRGMFDILNNWYSNSSSIYKTFLYKNFGRIFKK